VAKKKQDEDAKIVNNFLFSDFYDFYFLLCYIYNMPRGENTSLITNQTQQRRTQPRYTPPEDLLDERHKHWTKLDILDKGTDLLDYTGNDPILVRRKLKQMAYKKFMQHEFRKSIMWEAFRDGYDYGIKETSPFSVKFFSGFLTRAPHRQNRDKLLEAFHITKRRLVTLANAEAYEITPNSKEVINLISIPFRKGYERAVEDNLKDDAVFSGLMGVPHKLDKYEYADHLAQILPENYKTYYETLFEILSEARNARDAADADARNAAEARANSLRSRLTNTIRTLGSRLYESMPVVVVNPEFTAVDTDYVLGRGRGKKNTRRRRKNRK
jgi:hypothetical protein